MADLRGLADGFMAGFNTADGALQRRDESELRRMQLQQSQQNADRSFGLAQAQFDYRKDSDTQDRQRQQERDAKGDQRWQSEFEQSQKNADRTYGIQAAGLSMRREELAYQRSEQKRLQRMQDEKPVAQALYDRLKTNNGQWDEEALRIASQISDDNPLSPKRFFGPDKVQAVREMNKIVPQVLNGSVDYNDPSVVNIADKVLAPYIKRGVGEKDSTTGKTIQDKALSHIGLTEDGKGIFLSLKTKYSDGSVSETKPMTRFASSDPQDNVVVIPLEKVMEQFRGYGQMVGAINSDPATAQFMNRLVNPTPKQENAEAKEYRTQVIDSQKKRASAIAKDPDNAAAINAQFDQVDDSIAQAYGQPRKSNTAGVSTQLDQWAAGDPAKVAFAKQVAASYAPGNNVSKEHLDAKYAEVTHGQAKQQNSQVAQQLRERGKTEPTHPPYYIAR